MSLKRSKGRRAGQHTPGPPQSFQWGSPGMLWGAAGGEAGGACERERAAHAPLPRKQPGAFTPRRGACGVKQGA
jgi:hypothetical protein